MASLNGIKDVYRDQVPIATGVSHMLRSGNSFNSHLFEPMRTNNFEIQIYGLYAGDDNLQAVNKLADYTGTGRKVEGAKYTDKNGKTKTYSKDYVSTDPGMYLTLSTNSFTAPSLDLQQVSISYGNSKVNYAGTPNWGTSSIEFNDFVGINTEGILVQWWEQAYNIKNELIGWATQYKKTGLLVEYDVAGEIVSEWQLDGLWLKTLNIGSFNQDGGNTTKKISGTLVYDRAYPTFKTNIRGLGNYDNTKNVRTRTESDYLR